MQQRKRPPVIVWILSAVVIPAAVITVMFTTVPGKKAPDWHSGDFSPNGRYYAYIYLVYTVTGYSRTGNVQFISGSSTYYLQIIDCETGGKLLKKPVKFKLEANILQVDDEYVWISTVDYNRNAGDILMFDLRSLEMKFGAGDLASLNPDISFPQYNRFFLPLGGDDGYGPIFEATDGRKYRINPDSGRFSVVPGNDFRQLGAGDDDCRQLLDFGNENIRLSGSPRSTHRRRRHRPSRSVAAGLPEAPHSGNRTGQ